LVFKLRIARGTMRLTAAGSTRPYTTFTAPSSVETAQAGVPRLTAERP
jgi:hypothetical protein